MSNLISLYDVRLLVEKYKEAKGMDEYVYKRVYSALLNNDDKDEIIQSLFDLLMNLPVLDEKFEEEFDYTDEIQGAYNQGWNDAMQEIENSLSWK